MSDDWDSPGPSSSSSSGKVADSWEDDWDSAPSSSATNDVPDEWDAEPSEKPASKAPAPSSAAKKATGPTPQAKKAMAQRLKQVEEAEKARQKALAAARDKAEAEERARLADPDYARKKKEKEMKDMAENEARLAADLFGFDVSAPTSSSSSSSSSTAAPQTEEEKTLAKKAAEIAARTGLSDGADDMTGINTPGAKELPTGPPSYLDEVDVSTKEAMAAFAKEVVRKTANKGNSALVLTLLKDLVTKLGPELKMDDAQELLRVVTLVKNEAAAKMTNKKKPKAGATKPAAPQLKGLGSSKGYGDEAYDDYDDYYEDDY